MATLGCLANGNPLWPLCIALPIQLASLLMTLVRKGLLTARGYHLLYTASLCVPFVVGECSGVAVRGAFVGGVRRSDGPPRRREDVALKGARRDNSQASRAVARPSSP